MNTIYHLLGITVAGGLGTLARYGVNTGAAALFGPHYPWGTYIVNMFGCFLFGLFSGLITAEFVPSHWKVYVLTGFLGGFTTFSAFAYENQQFMAEKRWGLLTLHLVGQNVFGVIAVVLGILLVERFVSVLK